MPVYNATVTAVRQRIVNTKDGRSSTIYDITDSNGTTWSTFRQPIANEANRLVGRTVEITGREEQRGQYKNYVLDDIRETNGNVQHTAAIPYVEQARQAQSAPPQQQRIQASGPTEKDTSIARQVAAKVSAQISNNDPIAFWSNLDPLVTYFLYGLVPAEFQNGNGLRNQDPHAQENQFVPQSAIDAPAPYHDTDSDIPF